jgi:hypothetical protein
MKIVVRMPGPSLMAYRLMSKISIRRWDIVSSRSAAVLALFCCVYKITFFFLTRKTFRLFFLPSTCAAPPIGSYGFGVEGVKHPFFIGSQN